MAHLVSAVRARAKLRYNDLEDGGTLGLDLIQEAHDEILQEVPMVLDTEDVALTDADPTYDLDEDIIQVWEATWRRSATAGDVKPLPVVTQAWLDINQQGWRYRPAKAEPDYLIYEGTADAAAKAQIRFVPDLDITVASGYPKLTMVVTRKQTLVAGSTLPQQVKSMDAYLFAIFKRFAALYDPENYEKHFKDCEDAKARLKSAVEGIAVEVKPEIQPFWVQQTRAR